MSPETTSPEAVDIDQSASLAAGQILHRMLQDGSGQDYFVYRPASEGPAAPLFVAIHDISRNARAQADLFVDVCERYGAILVAPCFAADRYPNYQRLGRSRGPLPRETRADAALDSILAEVASLTGSATARIHLFGYAAGGRFAMRYAMAHPERVAGVLIAAAGTYTFPDPEKRFPRGIGAGPGHEDLRFDPEQFLRVPMTVFEAGSEDASRSGPRLRGVGRSGKSLSERSGRNWVAAMRAAAELRRLEPVVCYREFETTAHTLNTLAEQIALPERVFETLFGAPRGETAPESAGEAALAPAGSPWQTPDADDAAAERERQRMRRIVLMAIGGGVLAALLAPLLLFVHYRAVHVVSREAVVRGHIADVGARSEGVVESVEVDTGDRVQAGQVIARLQDSHFRAKVRQARSQLEKASRELDVERLAINNERLRLDSSMKGASAGSSAASAQLRAAQSRAEEALRRLELQRSLAAQGLLAEEQVRTAETEYRTAIAMAEASRAEQSGAGAAQDLAQVESEGLAVRQRRISVLESEIAAYQAELALAEVNLEGAIIRAPDDGAVVRRIIEPGGATVVGQPIISIWVGEQTWVEAWIDEGELADVEVGCLATVTLPSYPDREFSGVVERIGVSTDFELPDTEVPQPRRDRMRDAPVVGVRIRLVDPQEDLFPGLSAVVGIRKKES